MDTDTYRETALDIIIVTFICIHHKDRQTDRSCTEALMKCGTGDCYQDTWTHGQQDIRPYVNEYPYTDRHECVALNLVLNKTEKATWTHRHIPKCML